jgi:hypothetical protein
MMMTMMRWNSSRRVFILREDRLVDDDVYLWSRQVTAEPSWAKGLETETGPGKQRITFRARTAASVNNTAECSFTLEVRGELLESYRRKKKLDWIRMECVIVMM